MPVWQAWQDWRAQNHDSVHAVHERPIACMLCRKSRLRAWRAASEPCAQTKLRLHGQADGTVGRPAIARCTISKHARDWEERLDNFLENMTGKTGPLALFVCVCRRAAHCIALHCGLRISNFTLRRPRDVMPLDDGSSHSSFSSAIAGSR